MKKLVFHRFGQADEVLNLEEAGSPDCPDGGVRLRLLASPINPADLNFIEGTYGIRPELPATAGIEGCGEVVESRASEFAVGDRVIPLGGAGFWAGECIADAAELLKVPADLDPLQAAMLKVNPATAWQMLTSFVDLPQGAWVVQNAANSGVGRAVIQLARQRGLRTINFVRRESLFTELRELGADLVLLDEPDAIDRAKQACGDDRPTLALNAVGGDSALRLMNLLGPGGTHVTYGAMARRPLKVPNGMLIFKDLRIRGFWLTQWLKQASPGEIAETYAALAAAMKDGNLRLAVEKTFPLGDYAGALAHNVQQSRSGKVLFVP
jgi:NADPH:quinone reductase-like Zn-dependent oxidoreductase